MTGFSTGMGKFLHEFANDQSGATAIEYGLIASGIFLAIAIAIGTMASSTNGMYDNIQSHITTFIG